MQKKPLKNNNLLEKRHSLKILSATMLSGSAVLLACGGGGSSSSSSDTTTVTVPGAPTGLTATAGDASATLSFSAPASNGGAAITSYSYTCTPTTGATVTGSNSGTSFTVTGLTNGVAYSCTVKAVNSAGSSVASSAVSVTPTAGSSTATSTLWIPPKLEGTVVSGVIHYDLTLATNSKQLQTGAKTATYGYNGSDFWGPTLILKKGTQARMQVVNNLAEETTTHWHGLLVQGAVDGGPHQVVAAGATWTTPDFTVKNNASTYWYHPHMHETTQKQLTLGAGGFIIVQDDTESALNLPRTYGTDDIPLMLTSRRFTTLNGVANQFQYTNTAYGDYLLTNGVLNAEVALPKQLVRLRILNAEIERDYNLGFKDGRTFYVIGSDGGLLSAPVAVTRLIMAPGERYEILVNLSGDAVGSSVLMQSFNGSEVAFGFAGQEPGTTGQFGSLLNNTTFQVLKINVIAATSSAVTAVPTSLVPVTPLTLTNASKTRSVVISGGLNGAAFTFDNKSFSLLRIDQTVTTGTTEAWTINAGSIFSHSFHIHGVQFSIVARSKTAIKDYEKGWKDTIYLPIGETVTFVAKFDDTANDIYPYMYHCHMSNHEDEGLMGQFVVQP